MDAWEGEVAGLVRTHTPPCPHVIVPHLVPHCLSVQTLAELRFHPLSPYLYPTQLKTKTKQ